MAYEVQQLDKQVLRLRFIGDFDDADFERYIQQFDPLREAATPDAPLLFLIDAHELGKMCAKARKEFTSRNNDPRIGRVAVLGMNRFIKVLAQFIVKASGRDNIRFFGGETEALTWLKSKE